MCDCSNTTAQTGQCSNEKKNYLRKIRTQTEQHTTRIIQYCSHMIEKINTSIIQCSLTSRLSIHVVKKRHWKENVSCQCEVSYQWAQKKFY